MASRSWNRVELIGNLTRDPELRYTPTGSAVVTFSIATNRTYTVDGEKKEDVDFHRIVAWNKLAELCSQLLKKGNRVFVSGRLQNRSWEGNDGQQRNTTEIVIEDMIILTAKMGSDSADEFSEDITPSPKPEPKIEEPEKKEDEVKADEDLTKEEVTEKAEAKEEPKTSENVDPDDIPF